MKELPPGERAPRKAWHQIGIWATVAWVVFVLIVTNDNRDHPLRQLIFIAPLAAWAVAMAVDFLIDRMRGRRDGGQGPVG